MVLESWRIPAKLLVFSLHWNPEVCFNTGCSSRVGKLAGKSEGKQAKKQSFRLPCPFIWAVTRFRCVPIILSLFESRCWQLENGDWASRTVTWNCEPKKPLSLWSCLYQGNRKQGSVIHHSPLCQRKLSLETFRLWIGNSQGWNSRLPQPPVIILSRHFVGFSVGVGKK